MARSLITGKAYVIIDLPEFDPNDPVGSLQALAKAGDVLLAHAEDGVVWGKAPVDGALVTSDKVAADISPRLRNETLWDARLFSQKREILIWRDGDWCAREISETGVKEPAFTEWYDEPQLLWGTHGEHVAQGAVIFTRLRDGAQGLRHVFPAKLNLADDGALTGNTKSAILMRHYLAKDEDAARVSASRLVAIGTVVGDKFKEL